VARDAVAGRAWKTWLLVALAACAGGLALLAVSAPADSAVRTGITVSPRSLSPGETVTTSGRGFPDRARGSITFGGEVVAKFTTSSRGTFEKRWEIPEAARSGAVTARAGSRRASATLKVENPQPDPPPAPQCADGQDNDGDGQADHPADPDCESRTDDSESPDPGPLPEDAERWSDPATWGGEVPRAGAEVTIPADKTVILDQDADLANLTVNGTLIFEDRGLSLRSRWIMVHGKLQIGTEDAPFQSDATISLTGADRTEDMMGMGTKVIGVMGGTLDIHGEDRRGWTRLTKTAQTGADELALEDASGWRRGDRIVVASTDYDPDQAEEATITSVSGNTVTLDGTLDYTHWGTVQTFAGRPVDERAEVALLSRNVMVQGTEVGAEGFGGQIMVMSGGQARIEGAELAKMGQKNTLRRYPLHFHMLGDAGANSYLKDTSLHRTYNRCVTIHGTNNLNISGNVCHDHLGHGFFMEDGAEHDNVLVGNLGLTTRALDRGQRLLQSDGSAATFWITNPDNVVRGNVAAGSEGTGFWLAFPEHPTGLSTNPNVWPRRTPLGEFSGNVAHSTDGDGLHVDNGPIPDNPNDPNVEKGRTDSAYYDPHVNPTPPPEDQEDSAPVIARFEDFTGYKNRNEAVWLRGANHQLVNATLADNAIGATFASEESFLQDSLVVGETANKGAPYDWQVENGWVGLDGRSLPRYWEPEFPIRGYQFYDGRVGARNTTFVNFTPNAQRQASGLGVLLEDAFQLNPKNFATNLRFGEETNEVYMPDPVVGKDGDASAVFQDTDGSVTGTAGRMVVANNPFLLNDTCQYRSAWNTHVCGADYATLAVGTGTGNPNDIKPVKLIRTDGVTQTLMGCCDGSTTADSTVFSNKSYEVDYNGDTTPQRLRFVLMRGSGKWVNLSVNYPVTPKVTKYGCDVASAQWCGNGKATSLDNLRSKDRSSYYYDAQNKKLHLKLYAVDTFNPDNEVDYEELKVAPAP